MTSTARKPSIAQLACTECGALADASCNCGAPYEPAGSRATKAIAANPKLSNRAIAEQSGVGEKTVRRARVSTASPDAVETRTGKDGKVRVMPKPKFKLVPKNEDMPTEEEAHA